MCVWKVLKFTIYLLVIMVSLTTAQEYAEKRSPDDRQSWFMGSRYGRSSGVPSRQASRRLVVAPRRDDRFHPGSRYGKRTQDMLVGSEPRTSQALLSSPADNVQCSYTGVADLYRCHIRKENSSGDLLAN